jgi:hypothetical protein
MQSQSRSAFEEAVRASLRRQVVVLNDNNFPFSVGRHTGSGQPDDNELILLRLPRPIGKG